MAEEVPEGEAGTALKKKHQDVETLNLEKVTDYVEEAEKEELGKVSKRRSSMIGCPFILLVKTLVDDTRIIISTSPGYVAA